MRIALVTPWFGPELIGGAERLAYELSFALARAGAEVEVLTTTCRSFASDWGANYHRNGVRAADGVTVRRFKVDSRDRAAFSRANAKLVSLPRISLRRDIAPLPERDTRAFFSDNINSAALLAHLRADAQHYDAVIFVPYLYGPTVTGVPLVADRAFIVPCLHDEAYAYLDPIRGAFARARGVLFNSLGEADVAANLFGPALFAKSAVIGHAVEAVAPPRVPITIGSFAPHRSRYVLYLGRQDPTKNVDFLLDAFRRFRDARVATSLQLVLAGPRSATFTPHDGVIALGPVAEDAKAALLTYARALAQPSLNESFSRAIYESWYAMRPVIVHGECQATMRAVDECGGGWTATSIEEWVDVFMQLDDASNDQVDRLGQRGWAAAAENGSWDAVASRTLAAITQRLGREAHGITVDQLVPLGQGAAGRFAVALNAALTGAGADASIAIAEASLRRNGAKIIVHATDMMPAAVAGDAIVAHIGDVFIADVHPPVFAANVGVLQTLAERGVTARLLPEPVDPGRWLPPSASVPNFNDGQKTVLSLAPLTADSARRLVEMLVALVGSVGSVRLIVPLDQCDSDALAVLSRERADLDLADSLHLLATDSAHQYAAMRAADVAVAFGEPLTDIAAAIDPLWFDIPVIAFDDAIVREVIEPCGIVAETRNPIELAALIRLVIRDPVLRRTLLAEGRRVRIRYAPEAAVKAVVEALAAGPIVRSLRQPSEE